MKQTLRTVLTSIALAMLFGFQAIAQTPRLMANGREGRRSSNREQGDSLAEKDVPKGYFVWTVDERFGTVRSTQPDTLSYLFPQTIFTDGLRGTYNTTGNLGAPRISRIYNGDQERMMGRAFVFEQPYDFFLREVEQYEFFNTKSPVAILDYFSAGGKLDGEDRFTAKFATNVNQKLGVGFKVDYLYGRGVYANQSHSSLGASLFGSYRSERYQAHGYLGTSHIKNLENGGIADDNYIVNPSLFGTSYSDQDIPVRLSGVRNQMDVNRLFFTHRYAWGYTQFIDNVGKVVKKTEANSLQSLETSTDSVVAPALLVDTNKELSIEAVSQNEKTYRSRFVPVAALVHTLKTDFNQRVFSDKAEHADYFLHSYYTATEANDQTDYLSLQNTFALEMEEGFRPWVKMGMRLFARHELLSIALPDEQRVMQREQTNYWSLGAQLMRQQSKVFYYNALGELRTTGKEWGEFNLEGLIGLKIPLRTDSLRIDARGWIRNEMPAYYFQHYHGRNAWWDNSLNKIFRTRVEGTLSYAQSRLSVGIENVRNRVYLQELTATTSTENVRYGVEIAQHTGNIQVASLAYTQHLHWGILHWDNELTLQKSSNDRILPLPLLNVWSNMFLRFKIARVLHTELGADLRYFTEYYSPTYSPAIGLYAIQATNQRSLIGNYPWINAYVNFMLKGVRFYVAYSHVNSAEGRYFMLPHYPTNPRTLRFGISWTFHN